MHFLENQQVKILSEFRSSEEEVQSIFLLDGISKLTYCYVNGLPNKGDTTKSGEGIGLLKPAFSLDPKA